jgi:hypothetical protein
MNTIKQVRVTLEEVATVVNEFETQVIQEFDMKSNPSSEIQYRGIGIQYGHGENIRRSDDEIIYDLKDDKLVGILIEPRTEFNNAEITMITTENRFHNKYDMNFSEAQDYISMRGLDIPWNDGDVVIDERNITQAVGNVLKWADDHPMTKKGTN